MKNLLGLVSCCTVSLACCAPREPGPHPDERGEVTFWHVVDSTSNVVGCTDASSWMGELAAPDFPANSYVMYKVSSDGTQAVAQSCTTTSASTCTNSATGIVFTVDGHTLVYDPVAEQRDVDGSACDLSSDQLWTLTDGGETGDLLVSVVFGLAGAPTDCAALETQIKAEAANGLGIDGCTVALKVDLEYDS